MSNGERGGGQCYVRRVGLVTGQYLVSPRHFETQMRNLPDIHISTFWLFKGVFADVGRCRLPSANMFLLVWSKLLAGSSPKLNEKTKVRLMGKPK